MDSHARIERFSTGLEEILTPETLKHAIETGVPLKHYIGFEISGTPHIGAAIKSLYHIKHFMEAGADCSIFLADWHAWINDKLGGDKQAIQRVGKGYFKECFSAAAKVVGVDDEKIRFVLGSELYHQQDGYWETVVDVAKHTTLARMQRSITILGRKEGDNLDFAKLLYPAMQVADIYFQQLTIVHAGMDQRKAHVVAREVAEKLQYHGIKHQGKTITPIAVHHHLVSGLQKPPVWPIPQENLSEVRAAMKMSKSVVGSAVFLGDSESEVKKKINNAFCMEKEIGYNPVLDWAQHLVFPFTKEIQILRPEKFGGNVSYSTYKELEADFAHGKLHPMDLKAGVGQTLADILAPARKHLEHPRVLKLKEEFEQLKVTR
ncbi:MAG: tyrosine--tRNA ligase [Candidatus Iainarchaeum archaeon]|uniref:tyrosine--tRNA ligase n=1 Tax=Candidatus Iainarchaeum sp. TaxID=3101447 RepID=A0A7T9DJB5_9ARCH|nr:MAG: tyrosine--tRNA ligase [Candidatus Diapherotrites archaeon]